MGWSELLSFFCTATETARDVSEKMVHEPIGSLSTQPLEHLMLAPEKWLEDNMAITLKNICV